MANTKISALTAATTPLAGTEVLPVVQSGVTKQVSVANLTAGRSVSATSFVPTGSSVPANGVFLPATNSVGIAANSAEVARFTPTKNLGLGVAPSAWGSPFNVLQIGNSYSFIAGRSDAVTAQVQVGANSYYDGSNWIYGITGLPATRYYQNAGQHVWETAASGTAGATISWTTSLTLDASSNLTFNVGNLVQGTAAKGINFTANTPAAGMTSQLLNWYEEGTWTPVAKGTTTAGTGTYSVQIGRYTRIGRRVFFTLHLTWSAHTGTGNLYFDGLPYASNSTANLYFTHSVWASNLTFTGQIAPIQANNSTSIFLDQVASNAAAATVPMDTSAEITISGSYEV